MGKATAKLLKDNLFPFKGGLFYKVFGTLDNTFVYDGESLWELSFANKEFHIRHIEQCTFPQIDKQLEEYDIQLKPAQVCWLP